MFKGIELKSLAWWYWLATVFSIMFGLLYASEGYLIAIGLTAWQGIHFALKQSNWFAFPVQVRFWYMTFLVVAYVTHSQVVFLALVIGTWAQLLIGYCGMARFVSLHPWNRNQPLTVDLLKATLFSPPQPGSIQHRINKTD